MPVSTENPPQPPEHPPNQTDGTIKLSGKRSQDHTLGLYLRHRHAFESEREGKVSAITGVIHTANQATVRLGVLAKVVGGPVGFGSAVLSGVAWMSSVMLVDLGEDGGDGGDGEAMFVKDSKQQKNLPLGYYAFQIRLFPNTIPSITMRHTGTILPCLKWYVFVEDVSLRSRVFLTIHKHYIADPVRVKTVGGAAGQSRRGSLQLTARLNSSCYLNNGDAITVNLSVDNPEQTRFSGFRVTVKQLLTVTVTDQRDSRRSVTRTIKRNISRHDHPLRKNSMPLDPLRLDDVIDVVIDPSECQRNGFVFVQSIATSEYQLAPSFHQLSLPVGSNGKRLSCSLEYYMNVHIVLPWSANLIVSLPFSIVCEGDTVTCDNNLTIIPDNPQSDTVNLIMSPLDDIEPLPFPEDILHALHDMDAIEQHRRHHKPLTPVTPNYYTTTASAHDTIAAFRAAAVSIILQDIDPLARSPPGRVVWGRRLVRHAVGRGQRAWDAVRVLLTRCQRMDTLTMQRLDDAIMRVRSHLL